MAYAAWAVVCVLWGTTYLGIRIALETIPPALLGGLRYTAAGAIMMAIQRLRGGRVPWRHSTTLAVAGVLTIAVGNGLVIWAEQWVPSGIAAVMVATVPFWMAACEAVLPDGEAIAPTIVIGLVLGFTGIVLLVWPDLASGHVGASGFLGGVLALQVACIGWAAGSALARRNAKAEDPLTTAALQMLFGGVAMLAIGTWTGEWAHLAWTPRTIAAELYLTVFGSIVGYSAYSYALRHLPSALVSLYAYANPVFAVVLGALILGEPLGARVAIAALLVLCGSAVVQARHVTAATASLGKVFRRIVVPALVSLAAVGSAAAQQPASPPAHPSIARATVRFLAGGALGLGLHESGHLVTSVAMGTTPGVSGVRGAGIPFFAITHGSVTPPREFAISSAGLWVQHAVNEVIFARRPNLRHTSAPVVKGILAFNLATSVIYTGAALARQGPLERDTRGMALSSDVPEPWIGVSVLVPAALDAARYYRPGSRWLRWTSRGAKVAGAMLIVKAVR